MTKYFKVEFVVEMPDDVDPFVGAMNHLEYDGYLFVNTPTEVTKDEYDAVRKMNVITDES